MEGTKEGASDKLALSTRSICGSMFGSAIAAVWDRFSDLAFSLFVQWPSYLSGIWRGSGSGSGRKLECGQQHEDLQSITQQDSALLYCFLAPLSLFNYAKWDHNESRHIKIMFWICFSFILSAQSGMRKKKDKGWPEDALKSQEFCKRTQK